MAYQQMPQNQMMAFNRKPPIRSPLPPPGYNSSGYYWASHPTSPAVYYDRENTNFRFRGPPSPPWTPGGPPSPPWTQGPQWAPTPPPWASGPPPCLPGPYFGPGPHFPPRPNYGANPHTHYGGGLGPHYGQCAQGSQYHPTQHYPTGAHYPPDSHCSAALHYTPSPPLSPGPPGIVTPNNKYSLQQTFPLKPAQVTKKSQDLPHADLHLLKEIEKDCVKNIYADGIAREIRYYGETAIILIGCNDAREVTFETGSRSLIIDNGEEISLNFNSPYREVNIDGKVYKIRLGAPTRELFIDGQYHEILFGSEPVAIILGGRIRMLQLKGPTPKLRIGKKTRNDLLAGKINLIVDAKHIFAIYLDAKPQRFEIDGIPHILQFVDAFHTVLINGVAFKFEFGRSLVPVYCQGEKHFLRFTSLPQDVIIPGYDNDSYMEVETPLSTSSPQHSAHTVNGSSKNDDNSGPLEFLISLLPANPASVTCTDQPIASSTPDITTTSSPLATIGNIDAMELLQKLVASGIVPGGKEKESPAEQDENLIKTVDFAQPKSLRIKRPDIVQILYSGIQCSSCGERFQPEESKKYSEHLDWHFRQNRRIRMSSKIARSRLWYFASSHWIKCQEIEDEVDKVSSWFELQNGSRENTDNVEEPSALADSKSAKGACTICQDEFELFYSDEKEEWHFRNALYINDAYYHPICYQDYLEKHNGQQSDSEFLDAVVKCCIPETPPLLEPESMEM